jgi:hypothetical protein
LLYRSELSSRKLLNIKKFAQSSDMLRQSLTLALASDMLKSVEK